MEEKTVKPVDKKNRVVLPKKYLKELGIKEKDFVLIELGEGNIIITKAKVTKVQ